MLIFRVLLPIRVKPIPALLQEARLLHHGPKWAVRIGDSTRLTYRMVCEDSNNGPLEGLSSRFDSLYASSVLLILTLNDWRVLSYLNPPIVSFWHWTDHVGV